MLAALLEAGADPNRSTSATAKLGAGSPKSFSMVSAPLLHAVVQSLECTEMLLQKESLALLAKAGTQQLAGQLSVRWQRELLEHHGLQADWGCQALGMAANHFGSDKEVMEALAGFQQACFKSIELAFQR